MAKHIEDLSQFLQNFGVACSHPKLGMVARTSWRTLRVDVAHGLVLLFGIGTGALVWGFLSQAG